MNSMKKIVVIEDNPDNRELVTAMLRDSYQVAQYENGPDAIQGMLRERPDLILLDISLPQMDGPEVVRRIRADSALHAIPIIALTAHAMIGDREKYLAAGFNDYVTKPLVDETVLLRTIARWLEAGAIR